MIFIKKCPKVPIFLAKKGILKQKKTFLMQCFINYFKNFKVLYLEKFFINKRKAPTSVGAKFIIVIVLLDLHFC